MLRFFQKYFCLAYSWVTGGYAIWVKDTRDNSIELKVAYRRFDPFDEKDAVLEVKWRRQGTYVLNNNGSVGSFCKWRFVQTAKHVEHQLRGTAI